MIIVRRQEQSLSLGRGGAGCSCKGRIVIHMQQFVQSRRVRAVLSVLYLMVRYKHESYTTVPNDFFTLPLKYHQQSTICDMGLHLADLCNPRIR